MSSATRTVTISQTDDDRWVAADEETGTTSEGYSIGMALLGLGIKLGVMESEDRTVEEMLDELVDEFDLDTDQLGSKARLQALSERVQQRFDATGVTNDDVEDAIKWARSQ